ncbi:hypothetical protein [Serratia marcescens]|uniref:Uncharacterized protein n=1 Tax=Serratia marcescens TaxID=615 RepID=A0A9X8VM78_SERMA|nr:hypothetical protein [Serratia marcescens]MBS3894883.1 hypothetical protein [Serratia marcescens]
MERREPIIIAEGYSNAEIYQWMKNKTEELRVIDSLTKEKTSLQERLNEVEQKLKALNPE